MTGSYNYAVAQYMDELASEDAKKRLNSVVNVMQIAQAFGKERTKTQLLPFLEGKFRFMIQNC